MKRLSSRRADAAVLATLVSLSLAAPASADDTPPSPGAKRDDEGVPAGSNVTGEGSDPQPPVEERAAEAVPVLATSAPTAEVTVSGTRGDAVRLQRSAEAVNVIDTTKAKRETADLGEVLARSQGISVRRDGGLGSGARLSLNGLQDDQIRFFLDGVPLDRAGYSFGIANVPINLVERVEVYRGVVPIRFGADALGGAVNLVSETRWESRLAASYQVGSFGTYRATALGRYRHDPSGFVVGGSTFVDSTRNDYPVEVSVTDTRGRLSNAIVRRFHDRYSSYGGSLEAGFVDRPWARRLLLRAFASTYDKELQNNVVMTTPYGEVTFGETVYGATLRYEQPLLSNLDLEVVANYAHRKVDFVDESMWVYDWFGRRVRERRVGGEIGTAPIDQTIWQNGGFARALVSWKAAPAHVFRFSSTPTVTVRDGTERNIPATMPDPLASGRSVVTVVSGVEYELTTLGERLQNVVFAKDYAYSASADELAVGRLQTISTDDHAIGGGDALRYRFGRSVYAKASYEYATRLPRVDEVFGNGVLIVPNLTLEPEVSHNGNVGPRVELKKTPIGDVAVDINAFLRSSDRLIVLLGADKSLRYENVFLARSVGVENSASWISPARWVAVDGTLTWQDVRNISTEGTFGKFDGDRIPNRPWLFASWGARVRIPHMPGRDDVIEPFYHGRYVHSFYRGWESQGLREFKQVVDAQVTHDLGISWTVSREIARVTSTVELDNLTNARVFDYYGVQRPGRALFIKMSADL